MRTVWHRQFSICSIDQYGNRYARRSSRRGTIRPFNQPRTHHQLKPTVSPLDKNIIIGPNYSALYSLILSEYNWVNMLLKVKNNVPVCKIWVQIFHFTLVSWKWNVFFFCWIRNSNIFLNVALSIFYKHSVSEINSVQLNMFSLFFFSF